MTKTAYAIRHVAFEDAGLFAVPIREAGYQFQIVDAWEPGSVEALDPMSEDLVVFLGGPIGINDVTDYPVLGAEIALAQRLLAQHVPIFGICLGSQVLAAALGARVYPAREKEIGWAPVTLTEAGKASSLAAIVTHPVLHWHGDTFDLPVGADRLAGTEICPNQAFSLGTRTIGLQFHAEVPASAIEAWLIGHAHELATAGIAPDTIRRDTTTHGPAMAKAAPAIMRAWLAGL